MKNYPSVSQRLISADGTTLRTGTLAPKPEGECQTALICLEEDGTRFDAETGEVDKDGNKKADLPCQAN